MNLFRVSVMLAAIGLLLTGFSSSPVVGLYQEPTVPETTLQFEGCTEIHPVTYGIASHPNQENKIFLTKAVSVDALEANQSLYLLGDPQKNFDVFVEDTLFIRVFPDKTEATVEFAGQESLSALNLTSALNSQATSNVVQVLLRNAQSPRQGSSPLFLGVCDRFPTPPQRRQRVVTETLTETVTISQKSTYQVRSDEIEGGRRVMINGQAEPGFTVLLFFDHQQQQQIKVGEERTWKMSLDVLEVGEHILAIQILDGEGKEWSADEYTVTVVAPTPVPTSTLAPTATPQPTSTPTARATLQAAQAPPVPPPMLTEENQWRSRLQAVLPWLLSGIAVAGLLLLIFRALPPRPRGTLDLYEGGRFIGSFRLSKFGRTVSVGNPGRIFLPKLSVDQRQGQIRAQRSARGVVTIFEELTPEGEVFDSFEVEDGGVTRLGPYKLVYRNEYEAATQVGEQYA